MIKRLYAVVFLLGMVLALSACSGSARNLAGAPVPVPDALASNEHGASAGIPGPFVTDLKARETLDIGTVTVWNDNFSLYVKYETDEPWTMTATHLYAATAPPTSGEPETFPYSHEELDQVDSDLYEIPLSELLEPGPTVSYMVYIAAHALVCDGDSGSEDGFAQGIIATRTLWAGQHINSGTVTVAIEGEDLVVTYETKDGWELLETHLYVSTRPPRKSAPGRFPYKHENLDGATIDVYRIPLSEFEAECGETLYFAAHTEQRKLLGFDDKGKAIYQEETGWAFDGDDPRIPPGKNWARYFSVTIPCGGGPQCETAWAWGPYELPGLDWGWYFDYELVFFII